MDDAEARKRRNRKKSGSKPTPVSGLNGANGAAGCGMAAPRGRSRTLSLGSAAGLNVPQSDSPPSQLAHSFGSAPKKSSSNVDFFSDVQVKIHSAFCEILQ